MTAGMPHRPGSHRPAAALLALLLATGLQLATAPSASAAVPTGPLFNQPTGTSAQQQAIRSRLVSLIETAAPGSTIKVAVYHFWDEALATTLAAAHTDPARQVNVQVMLDESTVGNRPENAVYPTLAAALGTDRSQPSFVGLCPTDKSCLGDPVDGVSINHHKFWTFSDTGGSQNVVVQTSTNLSTSAYSKFWNDAMVVSNAEIHRGYSAYFDKLAGMDWNSWRYTYGASSPYKYYFFPRGGTTNSTDTVRNILDNVTCTWTDSTGKHRTFIRVGMYKLTRQAVADKLASMQRNGCSVRIVYALMDSGSPGTWESLHFSGGPDVRCLHYDDDGDPTTSKQVMHSKYLLISGMYAGTVDKAAWTGSHNFTGPALRKNDEALLKVNSDSVHDTYRDRFEEVQATAEPGSSDNTPACKGVDGYVQREL